MALFTVETARQAHRLSQVARKRNSMRKTMESLREEAKLFLASMPAPKEEAVVLDMFIPERIRTTRELIWRIEKMLKKAVDAKEIEQLVRSVGGLSEQERILSGRPLPGQLKPSAPKGKRGFTSSPSPVIEMTEVPDPPANEAPQHIVYDAEYPPPATEV